MIDWPETWAVPSLARGAFVLLQVIKVLTHATDNSRVQLFFKKPATFRLLQPFLKRRGNYGWPRRTPRRPQQTA